MEESAANVVPDPLERDLGEVLDGGVDILGKEPTEAPVVAFRGRETELGRDVVVKVLRPGAARGIAGGRFEREARAVAALRSPGVPSLLRFGRLPDGTPYMVSERVEGVPLDRILAEEGPLGGEEARRILSEVAGILAAAHGIGIVHRDVRPARIVREEGSGRILLTDFGIAAVLGEDTDPGDRLTRPGELLGDPRHASPEQLRGGEIRPRSDVYSIGVLGYELLTGHGPFRSSTNREAIRAHLEREPEPLPPGLVDERVADILLRCLRKDPSDRPDAATVAAVTSASAGTSASSTDGTRGPTWMDGALRRRMPQAVLLVAAAGWVVLQVVDQLVQNALLPSPAYPLALATTVAGLAVAGIVAYFHGEKGRQRIRPLEVVLIVGVVVGLLAVSTWIALG